MDTSLSPKTLDLPLQNCWRVFIDMPAPDSEQTLYIEAITKHDAHEKVQKIISAIFPLVSSENAYYNLMPARELVVHGSAPEIAYRLFETGWHGDEVVSWVDAPIFAVPDPGIYTRAWMEAVAYFETTKQLSMSQ